MKKPEPIYPEPVEKIKAKYRAKIDAQSDPIIKKAYQTLCDTEVAEEIGRQRQEAIAHGGALGARIKAENEEMRREMAAAFAEIDPKALEEARKRQQEMEQLMAEEPAVSRPKFCRNCGAPFSSGKFCEYCGTKLI